MARVRFEHLSKLVELTEEECKGVKGGAKPGPTRNQQNSNDSGAPHSSAFLEPDKLSFEG